MSKIHNYKTTFSKRRTVAVSVNRESEVIVKAPLGTSQKFISSFVEKHRGWIEAQLTKMESKRRMPPLLPSEIESLKQVARRTIPEYVTYWAGIMNVKPAGVKITSAKSRWGSCSWKNVLCFPYRIMLLPPELIECIVVHELAHIIVKNHSAEFYKVIENAMPDYKERAKSLKTFVL